MITQQQALEALEALRHAGPDGWGPIEHFTTLRQYIEQGAQPGVDGRALLAEQARPTQVMQEARETLLIAAANFGGVAPSARDRCIRAANALHEVYTAQPLKAEQAKDAAEDARMTTAARDVLAERQRQVSAEGWTPEHDDEHRSGDMARAAASYAAQAGICGSWPAGAYMASLPPLDDEERGEMMWPWNREWWKPKNPRADLVRAGALILAEIERMDRAASAAERKA